MPSPVLLNGIAETTTTTGTGTLTLAGAKTGYSSFSGVGDGNTCYYVIRHQSADEWEYGIGTYTASGTTLARTTVLGGSNGTSAETLSAGTKDVFSSPLARHFLQETATKTADFTAVVGEMHPVDLDTAADDVIVTFPTSPAPVQGDTFGYYVRTEHSDAGDTSGFAQVPFFCVEPIDTTSINGASYTDADGADGGGKYSLWLRGESLEFIYDGASWRVSNDGRKKAIIKLTLGTSITTNAAGTWTDLACDTVLVDNFSLYDSTHDDAQIKRAGDYFGSVGSRPIVAMATTEYYGVRLYDGTLEHCAILLRQADTSSTVIGTSCSGIVTGATAGGYVTAQIISEVANRGSALTNTGDAQDGVTQMSLSEELT